LYPHLPIKLIVTQRYDSLSKIKDLTIPKLIIHSRDDEIIPFSQGERLYAAALFPKEFFEIRGGHNEAALLNSEKFSQKINNFLLKYIVK
ncbi:MAG: alpha/beta hydrolase, partial [Candidatus Ratteibacteria bacterium]|nr:alpha/beta hydrolase [Candidatus Ratteibacteria bacterium]